MNTHTLNYQLNNKGMTLIELIVSMLLLSIILVFLYGLISNIVFKDDANNYQNTASYALILSVIQEDLAKYQMGYKTTQKDVVKINKINENEYFIYFNTIIKTTSLEITYENDAYKMIYIDTQGKEYVWSVPKRYKIDLNKMSYNVYNEYINNNIVFILNIPVYNSEENAKNNLSKNDFIIEYFGTAKKIG